MYFKNKIIDAKTIKENLVGTWSKLYELDDANKALIYLNDDKVKGLAVLVPKKKRGNNENNKNLLNGCNIKYDDI